MLLFGQYVYYHGHISYRQLIDALVWQKMQRPLFGSIAVRWGWLDEDEVREILGQRRRGEKFGESALRNRYLTSNELRIILGRQRILQPSSIYLSLCAHLILVDLGVDANYLFIKSDA